jgi:predicted nucleic acid-binding protein
VKIIFDTSVLVASVVEAHPSHVVTFPWLKRAKAGEFELLVASHSLAETYAVLSSLPVSPRISPILAWKLVHDNVEALAEIIELSAADYSAVIRHMGEHGLSGGIIYDQLIVRAAEKAGADRLLTINTKDFTRLWPEFRAHIISPSAGVS